MTPPGEQNLDVACERDLILVAGAHAVRGELAEPLVQAIPTIDVVEWYTKRDPDPGQLNGGPRLILLDHRWTASDSDDLLAEVGRRWPRTPIVAVVDGNVPGSADRLDRAGVAEVIVAPLARWVLVRHVKRWLGLLGRRPLAAANGDPEAAVDEILGNSPGIRELRALIAKAAPTNATVLITGESGVGKERVARALHAHSRRREGPFVAFNCSALPEGTVESELFGHVSGAFTGARSATPGLFQAADGGTVFLDEISDMSLAVQAKVLRALEERAVRPVGGVREIPFDARVLAATNQPLRDLVAQRRFREDLFYRIAVICVDVPPLRERGDDVLILANHFAREFSADSEKRVQSLSFEAQETLRRHPWPGNVRELKNCIERTMVLQPGPWLSPRPEGNPSSAGRDSALPPRAGAAKARVSRNAASRGLTFVPGERIGLADLPERVQAPTQGLTPSRAIVGHDAGKELTLFRRRLAEQAFQEAGGDRAAAARRLNIHRNTLRRWLKGN